MCSLTASTRTLSLPCLSTSGQRELWAILAWELPSLKLPISYFTSDNNDLILRLRLIGLSSKESSTNTVVTTYLPSLVYSVLVCLHGEEPYFVPWAIELSLSVFPYFFIFSDKSSPSSCYTSKEDSIIEKLHLHYLLNALQCGGKLIWATNHLTQVSQAYCLQTRARHPRPYEGYWRHRATRKLWQLSCSGSTQTLSPLVPLPEWVINPLFTQSSSNIW